MNNLFLAIALGLWSGVAMVLNLSGVGVRTPLLTGVVTGLCIGNVNQGFEIGAICQLMSIGFYTYGGATIPDYVTGAIFGTIIYNKSGNYDLGLANATLLGLLMTQMDILGRATTTVFQHLGDAALAKNSIKTFELWTILGTLPWILSRAIPTFLGVLFSDNLAAFQDFANSVNWIRLGLAVVGKALPAVGFALLLSYMDLKKYWPFLALGYVLFAYMGVNTIGLAIIGAAAGALYISTNANGGAA
ncbi:MAG: PTS sugar transporter subunit IIC [Erysipelotrichaceae bacterium]|jgi:PTS system mannose-specific IIC component|nr:PTS sugar transporter subunit IIC [Erysipelotrichaceae bacterium]